MYTTVEAIQEEGGYVEVELIIRDDAGFILCTEPIGCCETPPLEVVEIIGTVLSGPQGERGEQGEPGPQGPQGPAGVGDMMKSVYDTNNDGVVDNSEKLGGYALTDLGLNEGYF